MISWKLPGPDVVVWETNFRAVALALDRETLKRQYDTVPKLDVPVWGGDGDAMRWCVAGCPDC
jgi:hypothetical protein